MSGRKGDELIVKSEEGDFDGVQRLLNEGTDVNTKSNIGWTALHFASACGHLDIARYLVDRGADVNTKASDGWTALHIASLRGHLEIVRLIVEREADLEAEDSYGRTALHTAFYEGHLNVARFLVEVGANVDVLDASTADDLKHFNALRIIREGTEHDKERALLEAANKGYMKTTTLLLGNGVDRYAVDEHGSTALMKAIDAACSTDYSPDSNSE